MFQPMIQVTVKTILVSLMQAKIYAIYICRQ